MWGIKISAAVAEQQMSRVASGMNYSVPASEPYPSFLIEISNSRLSEKQLEKQRSKSSVEFLYLYNHGAVSPLEIIVNICQRYI